MADQAVLAEIARLEGELGRIRGELDALKRKVEGPIRRHTKAFTSRPPAFDAIHEGIAYGDAQGNDSESMQIPRVAPPPDSIPASSIPAPSPSIPAASQTVSTAPSRRRSQPASVGLSDFPPPTQSNTPARRGALGNPEAGRYEYVGDGRPPTRKSR